jgi:hypothetical protein
MIPARYLLDIMRGKNEDGQPHQDVGIMFFEVPLLCRGKIMYSKRPPVTQKKFWGRSFVTWKKKMCWCWQGFFFNFFDSEYLAIFFPKNSEFCGIYSFRNISL